jgi:hypothetical protein
MKYNDAHDCRFTQSGIWVWWAKRRKPGDKVLVWCYWNCRWFLATVEEQRTELHDVGLAEPYYHASWYRMRPTWYRFFTPWWWLQD